MKFYSDKTKKLYESESDLVKAEKQYDEHEAAEKKKKEARAARAKEVSDAYEHYEKLLEAFIKDYGSYHTTITHTPASLTGLLFDWPF